MSDDAVNELLHDKHRISPDLLAALRPEDLERVRSAAMDRASPNRVRAIDLLVAARVDGTDALLATILRNGDDDTAIRAMAAGELGKLGGRGETERVLQSLLLEVTEPVIQTKMAGALARMGTPNSLDVLGRLAERADGALRQQVDFARFAIASRYGIRGFEPPTPDPHDVLDLKSGRAQPFTFSPAPLREALVGLWSIGSEPYGIRLEPKSTFVIQCGPTRMLVALHSESLAWGSPPMIATRPFLAGLVAEHSQEDGSYSVRWLILSWPDERESRVKLALHRPAGPQIMFGILTVGSKDGDFELRSLRRPGAVPALLRGRLHSDGVEISEALSELTAIPGRVPTPFQPPRP